VLNSLIISHRQKFNKKPCCVNAIEKCPVLQFNNVLFLVENGDRIPTNLMLVCAQLINVCAYIFFIHDTASTDIHRRVLQHLCSTVDISHLTLRALLNFNAL
jgi:hypothetical protein